ncbi:MULTISPECIES: hypothetical protein [unclassified Akkermansia]|jgi:uncharacterized membrane-anchored protein|uniref:hypothetical protein n=1 Tax=unclassified Akkermansia TaxID=2608915 RepID=UPI00079B15B2|nr:hypothetical protein [Akkermansia sp. KLE1798]KXT50412.1 hypothetical protein HMPREF3038_01853 [Akkermansia sp. KLE1797]
MRHCHSQPLDDFLSASIMNSSAMALVIPKEAVIVMKKIGNRESLKRGGIVCRIA